MVGLLFLLLIFLLNPTFGILLFFVGIFGFGLFSFNIPNQS